MRDSLKDFVDDNRADFERKPTDLGELWPEIGDRLNSLEGRGRRRAYRKVMMAVAAMLLLAIGFWYGNQSRVEEQSYAYIPQELAESQLYYGQLIDQQMELLKPLENKIDKEVLADLARLDEDLDLLLQDLDDLADNEEVVMAIIQLYRTKLDILNAILEELQKDEEGDEILI